MVLNFGAKQARNTRGVTATQLAAARQEVVELAPATREVANLRVREKDAHDDALEAMEKLTALIERACMDTVEAEGQRKERDDLLQAIEVLHMGIDLARQECAVVQ